MKKFAKITAVVLALFLTTALVAQDYDDEPAPGRRRTGWSPLKQTLSVGLFAAYHLSTTYEINGHEQGSSDVSESYFGLGARIYPLLGGKLGFGVDMMLLDSSSSESLWLVDFDFLLRIQLVKKLTVNGGLGWSQYFMSYEDTWGDSQSEWGKVGFNIKIGAEYFLSRNISITGDWKWTTFEYDDYNNNTIGFTHFTFQLGIHYWL